MDENICQEQKVDEKELRSQTHDYWYSFEGTMLKPRLEHYVDDLLNKEMCWALLMTVADCQHRSVSF